MGKVLKEKLKEIIDLYRGGKSLKQIADLYKVEYRSIKSLLKSNNIIIRGAVESASLVKHKIGDKYSQFERVDNEWKAYYLGLILTDGCVYQPKVKSQKQIKLQLVREDEYILCKLKELMGATQQITRSNGMSSISICSNKLAEDLSKYSIVERKTGVEYFPKLPSILIKHFIRGVFDGDGCVSKNRKCIVVNFVSASFTFIQELKDILYIFGVTTGKILDYKTWYSITVYSKRSTKTFYDLIYRDCNICLRRKKIKFDNFKMIGD